jgi:nicotinic acid mononucleotide adenylyltransferase
MPVAPTSPKPIYQGNLKRATTIPGVTSLTSSVPSVIAPDDFLGRIHASGTRFVVATTGGGSQAISTLLAVPGGSRSMLAATIPYSSTALVQWLGAYPEHFCTERTARLMAMTAYQQAINLAANEGGTGPVAGIACTASLVSDRPKRGAHRIHVAAQTAELTAVASLDLSKGARDRHGEELIAARLLLNMIAQACGLGDRLTLPLTSPECVIENGTLAPADWQTLVAGEINALLVDDRCGDGATGETSSPVDAASTKARAIFPGAFHPLHAGHLAMAQIAEQRLGAAVAWEISITNVDKPPLDFHEMRLRATQFALADTSTPGLALWFTRAPTFVAKASIFPGATFLVGADTIERIAQPRYYRNDAAQRDEAVSSIAEAGCRFLVFGRRAQDRFETLVDLNLPPELRALCEEVSEAEFRADISSTELRRAADESD